MVEKCSVASVAAETLTCPSARCEPGSTLLGIVNSQGHVEPLRTTLVIDEAFVEKASKGRSPEHRFRFANQCVESDCAQWTGSGCGIIEQVLTHLESELRPVVETSPDLPPCLIRKTCRWYRQRSGAACVACTYVVTDQSCWKNSA
jgi:hypothetical protein